MNLDTACGVVVVVINICCTNSNCTLCVLRKFFACCVKLNRYSLCLIAGTNLVLLLNRRSNLNLLALLVDVVEVCYDCTDADLKVSKVLLESCSILNVNCT